jgi:hypothetical protein
VSKCSGQVDNLRMRQITVTECIVIRYAFKALGKRLAITFSRGEGP